MIDFIILLPLWLVFEHLFHFDNQMRWFLLLSKLKIAFYGIIILCCMLFGIIYEFFAYLTHKYSASFTVNLSFQTGWWFALILQNFFYYHWHFHQGSSQTTNFISLSSIIVFIYILTEFPWIYTLCVLCKCRKDFSVLHKKVFFIFIFRQANV